MHYWRHRYRAALVLFCSSLLLLNGCAYRSNGSGGGMFSFSSMPDRINTRGEKVIVVDPNIHAWGAYAQNGELVRSGMATAGGDWCPDIGRSCRTSSGTFRIHSLGDGSCVSKIYPVPRGGGLMPYCMFFNNGQALHGSPPGTVVAANISHGCVRMQIPDAEWIRYNFANVGTKVVVKPY